jgi:hypothetical protein
VLILNKYRKTWDLKSREFIFVRYAGNSKAYHLIDPQNPTKIIIKQNVRSVECCDRNTPLLQRRNTERVYAISEPPKVTVQSQPVHLSTTAAKM